MTEHNNTRLRPDVRFRELTVLRTEEVTPHMRRIVLGGDDRPASIRPAPTTTSSCSSPTLRARWCCRC